MLPYYRGILLVALALGGSRWCVGKAAIVARSARKLGVFYAGRFHSNSATMGKRVFSL